MGQNNQQKLLVAFGNAGQEIEDALQQVYSGYWIDEAVGDQLDIIGKLVGQLRGGMVDDDYRRLLRARISVNRSKGAVSDVLTVAKLVVDDEDVYYRVSFISNATFVLELMEDSVPDDVAELTLQMLADTKAAGVRIVMAWTTDIANVLIWGEGNWNEKNWASDADA